MILKNVRCDWVFLLKPSQQNDKYGVCALIPKGSALHKQVEEAIQAAVKKGIEAGTFTAAQAKAASFKSCLRDGDLEVETEERPKHYAGHMFFNAYAVEQPGIVGPDLQPLMDADKLYSGARYHLDVNFYPYSHPKGGRGIGAGLNNVMWVADDERLDGRQSAEEAFADLAIEADTEDAESALK